MTQQERIAAALIARGDKEETPSRKYRIFRAHSRPDHFFFVGKMGGLRYGTCITNSISLTDGPVLRAILNAHESKLAESYPRLG